MEIHCKHVVRWTIQLNGFQCVVRVAFFFFLLLSITEIKPGKGIVLRSESLCLFILCHYRGRVLPRGYDFRWEVLWKEFMIRKIWRAVSSLKYVLCEDAVVSNIFILCSSAVRLARSFTFVFFHSTSESPNSAFGSYSLFLIFV